jgi:hypothetical protein
VVVETVMWSRVLVVVVCVVVMTTVVTVTICAITTQEVAEVRWIEGEIVT